MTRLFGVLAAIFASFVGCVFFWWTWTAAGHAPFGRVALTAIGGFIVCFVLWAWMADKDAR